MCAFTVSRSVCFPICKLLVFLMRGLMICNISTIAGYRGRGRGGGDRGGYGGGRGGGGYGGGRGGDRGGRGM